MNVDEHAEAPEPATGTGTGAREPRARAPVPRQSAPEQGPIQNAQCAMPNAIECSTLRVGHSLGIEHSALSIGHGSENEHRIAVAVEPVPPLNGLSIDGEDLVAARKRRREDQQRRLR